MIDLVRCPMCEEFAQIEIDVSKDNYGVDGVVENATCNFCKCDFGVRVKAYVYAAAIGVPVDGYRTPRTLDEKLAEATTPVPIDEVVEITERLLTQADDPEEARTKLINKLVMDVKDGAKTNTVKAREVLNSMERPTIDGAIAIIEAGRGKKSKPQEVDDIFS